MATFTDIKNSTDSIFYDSPGTPNHIEPLEVGDLIKDLCDVAEESIPQVRTTTINYVPTATGNSNDLGRFVRSSVNGMRYFIDLQGNAFAIEAGRKPIDRFYTTGATTTFNYPIPAGLEVVKLNGVEKYKNEDWTLTNATTITWINYVPDNDYVAMEYDG
jgi:hypothetical protein